MRGHDLHVQPLGKADELLLRAAMLPDEERAQVIVDMERMAAILRELNELLGKPGIQALAAAAIRAYEDKSAVPVIEQRPVIGSPLCDTCSVFGACGKKSAEVAHCNDWRQFVPGCKTCALWDGVACIGSLKCQGGDRRVERERPTTV
jgi:hypothetical protein